VSFSDYIVYADESGDHGLASVDADYPVFVLCFCVFRVEEYISKVVPLVQDLKFRFFGHDAVVLHAHEIRKSRGPFKILFDQEKRRAFLEAVNAVMERAPFTLIAAVIDKKKLLQYYEYPSNPYDLALTFCLERTYAYFRDLGQQDRATHVVVERRGKQEDNELELVFRRVVQGANYWRCVLPFDVVFAHKEMNSSGLQLADLVAHPVGRHQLKPGQPNRAYELIAGKFRVGPTGAATGYGLKVFP